MIFPRKISDVEVNECLKKIKFRCKVDSVISCGSHTKSVILFADDEKYVFKSPMVYDNRWTKHQLDVHRRFYSVYENIDTCIKYEKIFEYGDGYYIAPYLGEPLSKAIDVMSDCTKKRISEELAKFVASIHNYDEIIYEKTIKKASVKEIEALYTKTVGKEAKDFLLDCFENYEQIENQKYKIGYIYGDLRGDNILYDSTNDSIAIIDYEGARNTPIIEEFLLHGASSLGFENDFFRGFMETYCSYSHGVTKEAIIHTLSFALLYEYYRCYFLGRVELNESFIDKIIARIKEWKELL